LKTIGIVLSGGSARGIAHLGVLEALGESGIKIDAIAGTSAGAIVAALFAAGNKPYHIKELLKRNSYFSISQLLINKEGIFKMDGLKNLLKQNIQAGQFEELPIRLFVAATNLNEGKSFIFEKGPLVEPVMASASVPFLFEPISWQGEEWVDGGILNNFPIEPLEQFCDLIIGSHVNNIIGSHVNKLGDPLPPRIADRKIHILEKCFHMAIAHTVYEKASRCNLFLDPPELSRYGMFDVRYADEIFEIGYRHCLQQCKDSEKFPIDLNQLSF
jgi:NTE family protein